MTARPMTEVLEPCPFCGGHAELTQYDAKPGRWWRVECRYCCAKSPGAKKPELAVPGWNRRSTSAAVRGMREAWQPISTAPQGEDVLIAVFRDDFEDPIIQNSILIDGEERGLYWSDWHGMPEPTHWMRYSRPGSTPAAPAITQAELVELLALMDAADSALDKDTYDQSLRDEFDAPDDADYSVCAGTVRKCSAVFAAIEKLRNRMRKP